VKTVTIKGNKLFLENDRVIYLTKEMIAKFDLNGKTCLDDETFYSLIYFRIKLSAYNMLAKRDYFKKELEIAKTLEVKYIVFHACNIKIIESLTYNFKYSDMEVLKNVVDILNEIFEGGNYNFKLLLENLWWSGLRLTNKEEIEYLLKNINYKNTGFILDTGHMINNNPEIKNSKEAVKYIKKNLENIGEYKKYILGMHLNYSLSGSYVKKTIEKNRKLNLDIHECMKTIYEHINNIDYHDPFEDKEIINVINSLPIEYLVFELIGNTKEELEDKIQRQWKIFE